MSSSILPPLSPEQPQPASGSRLTVTEFHRLIDLTPPVDSVHPLIEGGRRRIRVARPRA